MSDDLDKLSKRRRHLRKALLWTPDPEHAGSAVAIRQTLIDLEDPFADANAELAKKANAVHERIRALFASGVRRHKEIQRALKRDGVTVSTKTIGRALKPE